MIDVVIVHRGYKDYLKSNLEITGKNNNIYLLGDETLEKLEDLKNVSFVNIDKYMKNPKIIKYSQSYVNRSNNKREYELFCFLRVSIMKLFMEEYNLEKIFHLDSDCILFKDINEYPFTSEIAYQFGINLKKTDMTDSIHNGLININFCNEFENLYEKIYIEKDISLIKNKINHHYDRILNTYIGGGICDMTFYYILRENNILDVQDLGKPVIIENKEYIFINNINSGEGNLSENQYELKYYYLRKVIDIKKKEDYYLYDKIKKKNINLLNIHFQGETKKFLNENLKKSIEKGENILSIDFFYLFLIFLFVLMIMFFIFKFF